MLKTVSAAIEINGIGPPRNPNPKLAPSAPPSTEITKIAKIEVNKIINLGFKNIKVCILLFFNFLKF